MTDRRTFNRFMGAALAASVFGVRAQLSGRVYKVGVLRPTPAPPTLEPVSAEVVWSNAFARMGYQEGRNFHRILQGAKPGEMPVDQPTNLRLALNLATAKAIGVEIPSAVVMRAQQVTR